MIKRLVVCLFLLTTCAFGQGYSLQNFSQFADGHVLQASSNYTTPGSDGLVLCNSWYGTGRCDATNIFTVIQNSANALSVVNSPACADGGPPAAVHSGKYLDWSSTAGAGHNNQILFLGYPAGASTSSGGSFWFCSTIPNSASFGTSLDGLQVIAGGAASRLSNYTSNGTSQGWNIEGVSHGSIPYTPNTTVKVVWQYVNGAACADTTLFTDCVVLRLYNKSGTLLGTDYASVPAGAPSYITLGNGNPITVGNGFHVQYSDVRMYLTGYSSAQLAFVAQDMPWDGILTPGHGIDWRNVGIAGGIPSAGWSQCVTTECNTVTSLGLGASVAQINSAMSSATSNTYVLIAEGTYNFSTGMITFPTTGHVALRAAGHGAKFVFSGSAGGSCGRSGTAFICEVDAANANITAPASNTSWTSGLAQGSTVTGVASAAGFNTTASASPTLLVYSACDTGLNTGFLCTTGSNTDNSQFFVSDQLYSAGVGCCGNGPGNIVDKRGLMEIHVATSIVGNNITLSTPIGAPNWASLNVPAVFGVQSVSTFGLENIQVISPSVTASVGISFQNAYNWWIKNSAVTDSNGEMQWGINCLGCAYGEIQSVYVFNISGSINPYGIRCMMCSFNIINNAIIQQTGTPFSFDGSSFANVVSANFVPNATFNPSSNILQAAFNSHAQNNFDHYELNIATQQNQDGVHGTGNFIDNFRNGYTGWWSQPSNPINSFTNARNDASFDRYMTDTFGVYGSSVYHSAYTISATCTNNTTAIWLLGTACAYSNVPDNDTLSKGTLLRYGNFDTVTNAVRYCGNSLNTGWGTTCSSTTEAPASASTYPAFVPVVGDTAIGQPAAPASFVYSARPSWWMASIPFPNVDPNNTSGTLLQCNGTAINTVGQYKGSPTTSASHCAGQGASAIWGGHASPNPAMVCALDTMGMPPDGSGTELTFDPSVCFQVASAIPSSAKGAIRLQGNVSIIP